MKLHFYRLSKPKAFLISKETLNQSGYTIRFADIKKGVITASKMTSDNSDILFFNILIANNKPYTTINLFSNMFSAVNGTFVAVKGYEESFCKSLHELIKMKPSKKIQKRLEEEQVIVL